MTTLWRHHGFMHLWGAQATSTFGLRIGREAIALSAILAGIVAEHIGLTPVLWVCVAGYAISPLVLLSSRARTLLRVDVT